MSTTTPQVITLGNMVTLSVTVDIGTTPTDDPGLLLKVRGPDGVEHTFGATDFTHSGAGVYHYDYLPGQLGEWEWRWLGDSVAQGASEGRFVVESIYVPPNDPVDLTDLWVLVPSARRAMEGPFGPPQGRSSLDEVVIYNMVADACGDIILFSGSLFGHKLLVKTRDPRVGYATGWRLDAVLDEWEGRIIVAQTALNYFFHVLRDQKTSQSIKNEGTEWQYTISVNVIRDYIANLQAQRDMALEGLRKHHPVIDRYASNIRVRDQATVALLEWWDTNSPGGAGGMPGGQEAAVIPWTPGWTGSGFTP